MGSDDSKKYINLENVLQKINQKSIAFSEDERKRNNKILQVIERLIQTLCNKSILFNTLYQRIYYGGSFYDNLKIGSPTEYDLDCLLKLPKIAEPKVVVSNKPGYVHIIFENFLALERKADEAPKYIGLKDLLVGNRICAKKVKSWMEKLFSTAIKEVNKAEFDLGDSKKCVVNYKMVKSGPAYTIKLEGSYDEEYFTMDIDLVPCFTFSCDQWPKQGYKPNVSKKSSDFFVVPKTPSDDLTLYWRLSFQEQERNLLSGCSVMKSSIKLIKKIRDRHQHKVASYYIKTVFLLELDKVEKNFWASQLSYVFVKMLRRYCEYLERKNIPYYWNSNYNLIGDLSDETTACIANRIKRICDHIDRICDSSPESIYDVVEYFLTKEEVDMEAFKLEVPLSKKLRKLETSKNLESSYTSAGSSSDSSPQSDSLSFEVITKEMVNESPMLASPEPALIRIEKMLVKVTTEQRSINEKLQCVMDKIEKCENKINDLQIEIEKNQLEQTIQSKEILRKIDEINRKDNAGNTLSVPSLLDMNPVFDRTVNF